MLFAKYPDLFYDKLGNLEGEVHLHVNPEAIPVTLPCRSIPISVREKLETELDRLVELEALAPVDQPTEWTNQFVAIMKKSGDVRICIDPKPLNEALRRERYQLLVLDEILPELSKARVFSKVDLSSAFWHLSLDEESSLLTTFITPFGRYKWLRLPFGLNVSSEIFQKRLCQALEGLPGVLCIADDIIIYGKDDQDHDENLERFLARCCEKGIKLKKEKLETRCSQIAFHGHILTSEGLKIDPDKVRAIQEIVLRPPRPQNPKDVQCLNGMVNYLSRFLPHLSDVMKPIRQLTHAKTKWNLTEVHETAFTEIKNMITSTPVLAYYDPDESLEIQCDSSQSGLGSVLMQEGRPVAYASRALTPTETGYAQIENEMLAILYSMKKFHQYTFGRHTKMYSDHKPLRAIQRKPLHKVPKRLQDMMIQLQTYDTEIIYLKRKEMHLADALSRAYLPLKDNINNAKQAIFEKINMSSDERLRQIRRATEDDESLQLLRHVILTGWPDSKDHIPAQVIPYFHFRDELSVQDGSIFKGERVVIPQSIQRDMLKRIHSSHIGVEGCLRRAHVCHYWPRLRKPSWSHEVPQRPWQKVGSDLFTLNSCDYLVTALGLLE